MRVALVGAELEENLALRYMASALEHAGHHAEIVPFDASSDTPRVVEQIIASGCRIAALSMIFTSRAREFCGLAASLRENGYDGRIVAGGHFASLNAERLLAEHPAFDAVGLGEGEELICRYADDPAGVIDISGISHRQSDGSIRTNPSHGNPDDLDALPFPKRTTFHEYFDKPIGSILSSRGCWRSCTFCSINAWYQQGGGKQFRIRSVENIVEEMKQLYFRHGVKIFNFQDDNFFLPNHDQATARFTDLRDSLAREGIEDIAIAVKARPDSITREAIQVLDDLRLFRVFLGVENASENGLRNLNRKCDLAQILSALEILNDFDIHIAFNILMFEPDTTLNDVLINLRFIERHNENPFNFCRAEAYAGTGLEARLLADDALLGDWYGLDYRLKDPAVEAFHRIVNHVFFDRNFSDDGLHYFNMQVDFFFQLLRRFHPNTLTASLRASVRNFIKRTNLDTYEHLCRIYDFVTSSSDPDQSGVHRFARTLRSTVDAKSAELRVEGERLIDRLTETYEIFGRSDTPTGVIRAAERIGDPNGPEQPCLSTLGPDAPALGRFFGELETPIPYSEFKREMDRHLTSRAPVRR